MVEVRFRNMYIQYIYATLKETLKLLPYIYSKGLRKWAVIANQNLRKKVKFLTI